MRKIYLYFLIVLAGTLIQAEESGRLYITNVEIAPKKQDGKFWDSFSGNPDLTITASMEKEGKWQKIASLPVQPDTFCLQAVWDVGVDLEVGTKIKIEVFDSDLSSNDEVGNCTLELSYALLTTPQIVVTQFDSVISFSYLFSSYNEFAIAEKELAWHQTMGFLIGGWQGYYLNETATFNVVFKRQENYLVGTLRFTNDQVRGSYLVECRADEKGFITIIGNEWLEQPAGFQFWNFSGKANSGARQISGDVTNTQGEPLGTFALIKENKQYVNMNNSQIELTAFEISDNHTILYFNVYNNRATGLYPIDDARAFVLLDPDTGKQYQLLKFTGVVALPKYEFTRAFVCYFEKIPITTSRFHCLSGEGRQPGAPNNLPWNWHDIPVKK